jgi:hypothetical protein
MLDAHIEYLVACPFVFSCVLSRPVLSRDACTSRWVVNKTGPDGHRFLAPLSLVASYGIQY